MIDDSLRKRRRILAVTALCVGALLVAYLRCSSTSVPEPEPTAATSATTTNNAVATQAPPAWPNAPPSASASADEPRDKTPSTNRLARAKRALETYLKANRYPPDSRPMSENPDMEKPHWVPRYSLKLKRTDGKPSNVDIVLSQDRRFLVSDEVATLSMKCRVGQDPQPCRIYGAWLKKLVDPAVSGTPGGGQPVAFNDGPEGSKVARVQPSALGFSGYHGLLRVDVAVDVGSESGATGYQLEYTPDAPATFTGVVEETVENGTLYLRAGINVKRAGQYVLYARVDDAKGKTFAFLSINQAFAAGEQKVPFRVFGKLLRDENPQGPWALRDLEGFRLLEDQTPDREQMSAREGVVHVTKSYDPASFSDAEWESADKKRYVDELTNDVKKAEADVDSTKPK